MGVSGAAEHCGSPNVTGNADGDRKADGNGMEPYVDNGISADTDTDGSAADGNGGTAADADADGSTADGNGGSAANADRGSTADTDTDNAADTDSDDAADTDSDDAADADPISGRKSDGSGAGRDTRRRGQHGQYPWLLLYFWQRLMHRR